MSIAISIVIPTFGRPTLLRRCLDAVARLEFDADRFEVIVVDDGSPRPLDSIVAAVARRIDARLIRQSRAGPATARNAGARLARGRYLAFTDDDCAPAVDWLCALERHFTRASPIAIGGRTINALPSNLFSTASQSLIDYLNGYYNRDGAQARFLVSNNLAVSRDAFHELGGFDSTFRRPGAEDRDLCDRWLQRGHPAYFAADAVVYHAHWLDLASFWWQHFNYGRGAGQFHRARAARHAAPIRIEPAAFYLRLLGHPLADRRGPRTWALVGLLALSQLSNAAGFAWQHSPHRRDRPRC